MKKNRFVVVAFILLNLPRLSFSQLPLDENGWTVFTPSSDTRIYYVDNENGNDATAQYVDASSVADPKEPGAVNSYKTIAAAANAARDGYPDWILLKRGGTWTDENLGRFKSGRSATEPMIIGYYGTSGDRPEIKVISNFIDHNGKVRSHFVLNGLFFYNYKQDPNSLDFDAAQTGKTLRFVGGGENILIEDCKLQFVEIVAQGYLSVYKNFKVRRSIVLDSYYANSGSDNNDRPSGIFTSETHGLLIEECVFDHNGWNEDVANAKANMYNHNMYLTYNCSNKVVKNNIVTRGAAHGVQLRGCGILEENLFVQNAVACNLGYHSHESDYDTIAIGINNVILEGRLMDPDGSTGSLSTGAVWGIWTSRERFVVENNIVANRIAPSSSNDFPNDNGAITDYVNNITYQWDNADDMNNANWVDPERSVASYHGTLGKTATFDAFITEVRNRPLGTWPVEYEAKTVNEYFREGFSEAGNNAPVVSFSKSVTDNVPVTINFTSNASDTDGDALSYIWKFEDTWFYNDGSKRLLYKGFNTNANASYTYNHPGTYKVMLTVYDAKGGSATYMDSITVVGNYPPVSALSTDATSGEAPLLVNFDASASYDDNEDVLDYYFDFGDGSSVVTKDSTISHVFTPGTYTVSLYVSDGTESSYLKTQSISVSDPTTEFTDYNVDADAFVDANNPDVNYGSAPNSRIDQSTMNGIFRVDYSANSNEITKADLYIASKFGANECVLNYISDDTWEETTVTWNNKPEDSVEIGRSVVPSNGWGSFTITEKVKNETDKVISVLLYQNGNNWQEFRYRETAVPYLKLETKYPTNNNTPVALLSADITSGELPLTVNFDASGSTDADSDPLTYTWDFGDGQSPETGASAQHTFTQEGTYIVSLIADDGQSAMYGSKSVATVFIAVGTEVSTIPVTGISLAQTALEIEEGLSAQLSEIIAPINATDLSVSWSSSDTTVAKVTDGLVTAVAVGTATINATTTDGSYTASCSIHVFETTTSAEAMLNHAAISIYPNPVSGNEVFVECNTNIKYISIYDMAGSLIKNMRAGNKSTLSLSTDELKKGLYIINIHSDNKSHIQKLIIN